MSIDRIPPLPGDGVPSGTEILVHLQNLILTGALEPGERLPSERDLASHLGVSRPLLRECLGQLEARRLVERRHGSGTRVTSGRDHEADLLGAVLAASDDHRNADELRMILETRIAELAASRMNPADLDDLERWVSGDPETLTVEESIRLDESFHTALARGTGNPLIGAVSALLTTWTHPIRSGSHGDPAARRISMEGHREILAAVRSRSPEAARIAMDRHLCEVSALAARG
ncbi:FadR/GntR family transcriptional regulator [Mycetocola saprophilus]|uniref:FadR/GntR family transcriptional regulator n=1 Tax=Mycetocola saprophilus TaxID=76636 RepID=UPI00068B5FD1|nr:FadR/GntR family transcriptional regulator [Mycetocola saprophilus]